MCVHVCVLLLCVVGMMYMCMCVFGVCVRVCSFVGVLESFCITLYMYVYVHFAVKTKYIVDIVYQDIR